MPADPRALRDALVDTLRADGKITSSAVEAAFRTVARERFLPPTVPLHLAYATDHAEVTKRNQQGESMSSVSAAYIQARMLEQAELRPGMSVLEIGSGGLNAALIAEIVGPAGRVVSVDIDPKVTDRAARLLDENGYGSRVRVMATDATQPVPGVGPFDAIIVTVGAWDIAPAWLDQLTADGRLVLPLIMNGVTRTVGFRRDGDHLSSTSLEVAGFVPMQGAGRHPDQVLELPGPAGGRICLRFDGDPEQPEWLDRVFRTGRVEAWSGVTIGHQTSFANLHLWFAWFMPGFCRLTAEDRAELTVEETKWFPFALVRDGGLAYLTIRFTPDGAGAEFGAHAYGPAASTAANVLVEQILAWHRDGRHTEPTITYWPAGSDRGRMPAGATVMAKTHGVAALCWPHSET